MAIERRWLHEQRFVLTTVSTSLDNHALLEHVEDMNRECDGITGLKEFADCRALIDVEQVSVSGITQACLREKKKPGSKLVILVPPHSPVMYGLARVYQMFASDSRDVVKVFTDIDDAMRWLEPDEKNRRSLLEFLNDPSGRPSSATGT
ncbi:MAG: hypothetical protein OEY28_07205 [Nitrospira sp.]|nr:hypothetical protein [Nitrospira sp.]